MGETLRKRFMMAVLAGSLLLPPPMAGADAATPSMKIGTIHLAAPLPFEPKELLDIFDTLSLRESPDKKQVILEHWFKGDIFVFTRSRDGKIYQIYSALDKNEPRLCAAFDEMKVKKPEIYKYLEEKFQASENCKPAPANRVYN